MNAILITLLVIFGFVMLLATAYKPVPRKKPKINRFSKQPKPKKTVMGFKFSNTRFTRVSCFKKDDLFYVS